ncbi:hypothetical protein ACJQWK_02949 [Exserohilum turcicum]
MAVSLPILASALALTVFYCLYTWTARQLSRKQLKKKHACLPPQRLPQKDPFLGTDVVRANLAAAKNHGLLDLLRIRHAKHGRTFTTNTFFRTTINTCDPRVLQSVLSLQFDDFGMGPLRSKSASPLLGNGIFTTDNEVWSHQRALIRPSFVRGQITDFSIFETRVDQLIQLIAKENYTVDLQHLLFRMVCLCYDALAGDAVRLIYHRYSIPIVNTCLESRSGFWLLTGLALPSHSTMLLMLLKKASFIA